LEKIRIAYDIAEIKDQRSERRGEIREQADRRQNADLAVMFIRLLSVNTQYGALAAEN
jgi:hypothetical protein